MCSSYSYSRCPVGEEVHGGPAVEAFFVPMGAPPQPMNLPSCEPDPVSARRSTLPKRYYMQCPPGLPCGPAVQV